ncbi:hypothetical protein, conserved [Eimeria tenella]|uniref:Uncharacterized protein n=1 Tax=Eimeria tenella TaxID=5802 RepID=U6KLX1_EIMTE|nr:hypothetical protein, conserved [Eimeria tenella]CDJ39102.1 hypothetical protein, conserved [Eimeria tenella]|eukprot:XP_013229857.1 hypothetical protein, conserved [Eimeria tenella]
MEVDNQLRPACLGCSKLHACLSLLVLAVNFGLGQSTLMSDQSIPAILERIGQLAEHTKRIKPAENDLSLYEVRSTSQTTSPLTHEIGREGEVFQAQNPTENFSVSKAQFTALLHTIKQQENLEEKACLKQIVGPSEAASLNPPELGIVKSSVDLHFGAFWMWDKVGRILLQNRVPPPLDVGDVVKVLGVGSTVLQQEEYTVAAVHGTAIAVEKDGVYLDFPRDRLILTIGSKYISIADSVLRNEIKDLNEDDPSILQDMEEIFKIAAVREAFQKTQQTGDPRHLQNAMKASETFHFLSFVDAMRELPSIEATPLQKPGKGKYKPDPAETSSIYTSEAAVRESMQIYGSVRFSSNVRFVFRHYSPMREYLEENEERLVADE